MKSLFLESQFAYDGSQLRSLFAYLEHKVQGDSILAWIGPCSVSIDHMVDGEDLLAGEQIRGDKMVHFIVEKFHSSLPEAVALQRLLSAMALDLIRAKVSPEKASKLRREGDDLYFHLPSGEGKLSISIATASPVSTLIHFAVNCVNSGTPVKTASLEDLGLDPSNFAEDLLQSFAEEVQSIQSATTKVRWVR